MNIVTDLANLLIFNTSASYSSKGACAHRYKTPTMVLGVKLMKKEEKFLGNSRMIKRNRTQSFENLMTKIKNKTISWQAPLISQARIKTLIKFVASTIPVYNMSILQLPLYCAFVEI